MQKKAETLMIVIAGVVLGQWIIARVPALR